MCNNRRVHTGFTLVELLVALAVTSVILSAVATLAFAMSSATRASEDAAFSQTEMRTATLHLAELIRNCRMICAAPGDDLVVWKSDDNNDGRINLNELVYIERGTTHSFLKLGQFSNAADPCVPFSSLGLTGTKASLATSYGKTDVVLIRSASNVQFTWDPPSPTNRRVVISLDLAQDQAVRHYEVQLTAVGSAANWLNTTATALVTQDDD
jgi:prepilin-type N-terminal cleavage/methylation domain-containing protein